MNWWASAKMCIFQALEDMCCHGTGSGEQQSVILSYCYSLGSYSVGTGRAQRQDEARRATNRSLHDRRLLSRHPPEVRTKLT